MSKEEDPTSPRIAAANGQEGEAGAAELTAVVDQLLNQLSDKFSKVSSDLLSKMDDMSRRLDSLETTIQGSSGGGNRGEGDGK